MENTDLIKEIVQSNEMLRIQIWILGGVLSFMLLILIGFARSTWMDAKAMLENHDQRIVILERNDAVIEERINNIQ